MTKAVVLIGLMFAAACDVGELPSGVTGGGVDAPIGGGGSDAGSGSGSGSGIQPDVCVQRSANIQPAHLHAGAATNAGKACIVAGCHLDVAPNFQLAGTVYQTGGTVANTGVTIEIQPNGVGAIATTISDSAGNFYVYKGTIANAFPAKVTATACPAITPMTDPVAANGGGDCNSCHGPGGTTTPITLAAQ